MQTATTKLVKPGDQRPTELETQVAQTLLDLETSTDLKAQLRELHITGAREVDISGGKKAIILFAPVPQLKSFQKIQSRLVRELEKKFSGKHFVIIAQVLFLRNVFFFRSFLRLQVFFSKKLKCMSSHEFFLKRCRLRNNLTISKIRTSMC